MEHSLIPITQSLLQIFDDDIDIYWMAKGIYAIVEQYKPDVPKLIDRTLALLEKEDLALYKYLDNMKVLHLLPINVWFDCCFAGILPETILVKIWDKLCGGSYNILIFVSIVLLTIQRHKLMKCTDLISIIRTVQVVNEESAEGMANKAIELWQQHIR